MVRLLPYQEILHARDRDHLAEVVQEATHERLLGGQAARPRQRLRQRRGDGRLHPDAPLERGERAGLVRVRAEPRGEREAHHLLRADAPDGGGERGDGAPAAVESGVGAAQGVRGERLIRGDELRELVEAEVLPPDERLHLERDRRVRRDLDRAARDDVDDGRVEVEIGGCSEHIIILARGGERHAAPILQVACPPRTAPDRVSAPGDSGRPATRVRRAPGRVRTSGR